MSPQPPPSDWMQFCVLGPLALRRGGQACDLGPRRQRVLLARLLLDANRPVPVDRLIADLWCGVPADRAAAFLRQDASGLCAVLQRYRPLYAPGAALVTELSSLALHVPEDAVDAVRFRSLAADAFRLLASGEVARAHRAAEAALWLWEGPALADVRDEDFAAAEAARLEALRLEVEELAVAASIALGLTGQAAAELEQLAARGPLRAGFWEVLACVLSHRGRPAEAMRRYEDVCSQLDAGLGLGPAPGLRKLERAVGREHDARRGPGERR